ncbi:anti-sigma factor [Actinomadura sp. NPDC049753]|uniref:anti-sigma factor n=1 Tax=Actinomadura sp. NPDC049753 TaxID=3154739 RepID=UPI00343D3332
MRGRVMAEIARTRQSPPLARRLPSPRARGLAWPAAAACLVPALAGAGAAWRVQRSAEREQSLSRQVAAVMSAPDARTSTVRTPDAATVTVVSSRSLGKAVVTTTRMPPLPSARTYQMWWLGPAERRPDPDPRRRLRARGRPAAGRDDLRRRASPPRPVPRRRANLAT